MTNEVELGKMSYEGNIQVLHSEPSSSASNEKGISKRPSEEGGAVYRHALASTITSFIIFITYGAALGALGATIPFLQSDLEVGNRDIGFVFTSRGLGYLVGTVLSGVLLEGFYGIDFTPSPWWSENKLLLFTFSGVVCGAFTTCVLSTRIYALVLVIFFCQGLGFGGADTIGNCLLPELWGDELGPWMQALHAFFGLGAVIGPALVGALGYEMCFVILGASSMVPVMLYPFCISLKRQAIAQQKSQLERGDTLRLGAGDNEEGDGGNGSHSLLHSDKEDAKSDPQSLRVVEEGDDGTPGRGQKGERQPLMPLPMAIRLLVVAFFVFYVGSESGYGGWISSYVLRRGVVDTKNQAAFVASVYWGGLTAGRLLAIPVAIVLSTSTHLKAQLVQTVVGVALCLTILDNSYSSACVASAVYSFALSSIFPLALTVVQDYGFETDASATASFIFASCVGDAFMPVVVGLLMEGISPVALPWAMAFFATMLIMCYVAIAIRSGHYHSKQ
jgi:FHS family Na+ dependent glucose MFS transporter 1